MPQSITFSSVFIRTVSFALDEGTKKIRINCSASWTKEVRDKMDWQELERPKSFKGRLIDEAANVIDLEGELHGRTLILAPNEKELKKLEFQIDIQQVKNFQLHTLSEESSKRKELRFQILTTAAGAAGEVETYTDAIGQGKGTMKVSYVQQTELDLNSNVEATAEQRAAAEEIAVN